MVDADDRRVRDANGRSGTEDDGPDAKNERVGTRAAEQDFGPDDKAGGEQQLGASSRRHLAVRDVAQTGMRELSELLGKQATQVTEVSTRHDGWLLAVEVVELERLPSSSDILALYEAELDVNGTLQSYRRTQRYARGSGSDSGGRR
jgi:hypothetical protein